MLNKQKANLPRANDQTTIISQTNKSPIFSSVHYNLQTKDKQYRHPSLTEQVQTISKKITNRRNKQQK